MIKFLKKLFFNYNQSNQFDYSKKLRELASSQNDYFEEFNHKKILEYSDYKQLYDRFGLAARIVEIFPDYIWSNDITVFNPDEDENNPNSLKNKFKLLSKNSKLKLLSNLRLIDIMLGYSRFAVLFIGIKGEPSLDKEIKKELKGIDDLIYFEALDESSIEFNKQDIETNTQSERYGYPKRYKIKRNNLDGTQNEEFIHHSRIIHFKEKGSGDRLIGKPRLNRFYNALEDLYRTDGASNQSLYLNGRGGLLIQAKEGACFTDEGSTQAEIDHLRLSVEKLYRKSNEKYIISSNFDVRPLQFPVINPKETTDNTIKLLAGALGIPTRILLGSERGELASTQDAGFFISTVKHRQRNFCEEEILHPTITRFMELGILPKSDYEINWSDLVTIKQSERAEIVSKSLQALDLLYRNPSIEEGVNAAQIFDLLGLDYNKENVDRIRDEIDSEVEDLDDEDENNEEEEA